MNKFSKQKKINILVTWHVMSDYIKKNKKDLQKKIKFDFVSYDQYLKEKDLIPIIDKYDGIICGDDEINKNVLDKATKLRVISKWGTGLDSINLEYAKKKRIKIFNTPNAFTKSAAQLALSYLLNFSRKTSYTHQKVIKGKWPKTTGFLLENKIVGIIGYGNIGKETSKLVKKLGMGVIVNDIKKIKNNFPLKKLLSKSDVVIVCCDLNKFSTNLINKKNLKFMKRTAGIINVSRGKVINQIDLTQFLKTKKIAFAGLDVFNIEPIKKNDQLLKLDNCMLGSHNAFNTIEDVQKVNKNTLSNLYKGLNLIK